MSTNNLRKLDALLETFGAEDMRTVVTAVRDWQTRIQYKAAASFKIGDKVQFSSRRNGTVHGRIIKIRPKTIKVEVKNLIGGGVVTWRVAPSLLRQEDK